MELTDLYEAGAAAERLGVSPSGLRRYATLYEQVHGELPRRPNTQSRLYPGEALERLAAARQLVETERAKSILEALQALEERHINECRGDRLEDELRRLELAGADQARLVCRHERQHAPAERYCADERFYGVEAFVYRTALEVYNVDLTTYTLTNDEPVTETSPRVTQAIEAFVERRDEINAAGFNLRPADKMRAEPLTVFGNLFRRVNLTTTSPRNQAGRERRINEDALTYMRDLITARREREAERLGFWDADLERSVFETGYPYNNKTLLPCLNYPVSTSPTEPAPLLPTAETHALGLDAVTYLQGVLTYRDEHAEPIEPDLFRELAIHELVQTAPEDEQGWVYERRQRRLLDGKPLADATAADLLRDGLAALGWARTRALLNRHGWDGTEPAIRERYGWGRTEWLAFAAQSLEARSVSPPPGVASAPPSPQGAA